MNRFFLILSLLAALSCRHSITGDILIEDVNIIDIETGKLIPNQDVVINGNRITSIVDHASATIQSKTSITGTNKYLIPGLWDMHAHTMQKEWYKTQLPLMRANGDYRVS
jgi:adenine deaminase